MAKKKSNKEKPQPAETSSLLEKHLFDLVNRHRDSRTTKCWLNDSRRCRKQHQYPQLVELTESKSRYQHNYYFARWNPPPPGLRNINTILEFASSRSYHIGQNCKLVLTGFSNPAFMVYTYPPCYYGEKEKEKQVITHKSTELDSYDANNGVMKFSYVIKSKDGKYYAVSSQGALVVMEQVDDKRIVITGICATRAVPSSASAKFFKEYLFESDGEILLVFLIYKESVCNQWRIQGGASWVMGPG